ncbi:Uncharacterized protein PFLU_3761 [Pseudomonas [fluorescens] SBW25]|uniref:Uncharacterized protein n=1 Tax=Pseudomonas fluorescens (strain SBW25) TaxID=216595 RepID=C3JY17_PSEFS|nr:Uncharacterized protein PFLU_3761 [Pseudomonas fluorescens SBW25]
MPSRDALRKPQKNLKWLLHLPSFSNHPLKSNLRHQHTRLRDMRLYLRAPALTPQSPPLRRPLRQNQKQTLTKIALSNAVKKSMF